ncbi:type II toxin-antitoxin system Phd/YefM family antitoxin [Argonema galeatum]|uniref:type II toxin-antitoxin system Phd/YefM family antitoxin n=1 Tax=Argonema galeatum TaxID=2942762 RepID=UPI002011E5F1|nr:type II toxin-antitoxin system prevent-host-death family antitoxin [Argonema galeatum]MCL1465734.1 type II toxin-antitoxin system prevent-host-death family antitoxin [Argonema galeatum A003/A1]
MLEISLTEASKDWQSLIEGAIKGEEILIAKDNKPVVKLVPLSPFEQSRKAGSAKGMVTISDDFDEPIADFEDYLQ